VTDLRCLFVGDVVAVEQASLTANSLQTRCATAKRSENVMTRRLSVVLTILILSVAFPIVAANADEIVIKAGSAIVPIPPIGTVDVTGTQGFELQMILGLQSTTGPWSRCSPCGAPGAVWPGPEMAFFSADDGHGTVKLDGNVYQVPSSQANVHFVLTAGSMILPPISTGAVLSEPFEVHEGSLSLFDVGGFGGPTLEFPLAGRGIATVELVPNLFAPLWEFSSVRYEFAPTPEPGTLSLLGSALAAGVVWCRRRSHS